ncbi:MAG TPA: glutamate formimidoyltransferase [Bryobacteraceae bacterium]|nr:glutamate formimidoyltransferase [Bryobacteraceae bacterium]
MAGQLIECVPNFSEGRDAAVVQVIELAIASVSGVMLLQRDMDPDHNRSVITFAGPPEAVAEGALRGIGVAVERIDLQRHSGVHPRIGAADVVPFVPLECATLKDCAALAHQVGHAVWERMGVPVYFYEAAAITPERAPLENVRRGGFENPSLGPDLGGPALHPTAGACAIGARKLLVAFNVNLNSSDIGVAKEVAQKIRASTGGLPFVKAMGVSLPSRGLVQVSMNLTNYEVTPVSRVLAAISTEAASHGISITGTEIVGLAPRKALEGCRDVDQSRILEDRLAESRKMK